MPPPQHGPQMRDPPPPLPGFPHHCNAAGYPPPPSLCSCVQARIVVDAALIETVLGPPKYSSAAEELSAAVSSPGVVAGLVWTAAGGGVQCVECVAVTRGEGRSEGAMGECFFVCIEGG